MKTQYPFTPPTPERQPSTQGPPDHVARRERIRHDLRSDKIPRENVFQYLDEYPEQAEWLQQNIEPRFWAKFESLHQTRPNEIVSQRTTYHYRPGDPIPEHLQNLVREDRKRRVDQYRNGLLSLPESLKAKEEGQVSAELERARSENATSDQPGPTIQARRAIR